MKFEELLNNKKIEKVEKTEFDSALAEKDLEFAEKGLETKNYDRVMTISYEAVLRIGNRLMNFLGYRAIGKEHHKNTFLFLMEIKKLNKDLVAYFDSIRKKRNDFIYRDVEAISQKEAEEIIKIAKKFVQEIRTFVQEIRTGDENE